VNGLATDLAAAEEEEAWELPPALALPKAAAEPAAPALSLPALARDGSPTIACTYQRWIVPSSPPLMM